MSEDTIYEAEEKRSRRSIASYFRRLARAFSRGEPAPVDAEQTVTVDVPAEPEMEVEVEQDEDELSLELEIEWAAEEGDVDTDADASKATVELYEDAAEEWRWRLVHDNGNIIADSGEGYASAQKAKQGLQSVKTNAPGAYVNDLSRDDTDDHPEDGGSNATFEVYQDSAEKWRWRLVHDNGNIIADGGHGYSSKQKAKQGLRSVKLNVPGASVEKLD